MFMTINGKSQAANRNMFTIEVVKMRQSLADCQKFRNDMQEHGNTNEDMQKWNQIAANPTPYKPRDERAARACRTTVAIGTSKPRWTQYQDGHQSPRVQPRFPMVPAEVYRVTEVAPCTQQLSVAFKQYIYTITNLAMDRLGLVTKLALRESQSNSVR